MGFVRALFTAIGRPRLTLYRGTSTHETLEPPRNHSFVSASFSRAVSESHFDAYGADSTGVLARSAVPVERVFMTYYETAEMNGVYREAEAVLLFDPDAAPF